MSYIFYKRYETSLYYEKSESPLFNRWDYRNSKFQKKLVQGLENLIPCDTNKSVFEGQSALYALSGLINPSYECQTSMGQIQEVDRLLGGMVTFGEYTKYKGYLLAAIKNHHPFEKNKWTGWDSLAGTTDFNDFGTFGDMVTSISGKSLDMILTHVEKTEYVDKFCGLNMLLEKNGLHKLK